MKKVLLLLSTTLILILSACRGMTFSPETAALNAARESGHQGATIDENSLQVRQTLRASDNTAIVVVTFNQVRAETGPEDCLFSYEVNKTLVGWMPHNGGGGCLGANWADGPGPDMDVVSGSSGSDKPGDAGLSLIYGLIHNPAIQKIRVTWSDDTSEEPPIRSDSFIAFRLGQFSMKSVEGLGENDEIIYSTSPQIAPAKENQ